MLDLDFHAARDAALRLGLSPPVDPADDAALVAWPAADVRRAALARAGVPRLLVLAPDAPPPHAWDDLEDWVRAPLDAEEVAFRQRALRDRREASAAGLHIDDGLLRRGDRWVALPPTQLALTRSMLGHAGRVVSRADLRLVFLAAGGADTADAFASCLKRLRQRVRPLAVTVHTLSNGRLFLDVGTVARRGRNEAAWRTEPRRIEFTPARPA